MYIHIINSFFFLSKNLVRTYLYNMRMSQAAVFTSSGSGALLWTECYSYKFGSYTFSSVQSVHDSTSEDADTAARETRILYK